eukprot:TRINITY_DN56771_c0_g1_i1.p1 TRINITY_DN56771_c0_g1~~TRINITY_DN56771_c0_g1_i1.p1  ORF type:complete len:527 (+),score=61.98 TRINITY_DN56771_c0_g1_i1:144-1583(+)
MDAVKALRAASMQQQSTAVPALARLIAAQLPSIKASIALQKLGQRHVLTVICTMLSVVRDRKLQNHNVVVNIVKKLAVNRETKKAVILHLRSESARIRSTAIRALGEICVRDDAETVLTVARFTQDADCTVRESSLLVLSKIVGSRVDIARGAFIDSLSDSAARVRRAALSALGKIGRKHGMMLYREASACLGDVDGSVRCQALEVLRRLAPNGDAACLAAVVACFSDPDVEVRSAAQNAFVNLAAHGDTNTIGLLLPLLGADEAELRMAAIRTIIRLCLQGYIPPPMNDLLTCLADTDATIRRVAIHAAREFAHPGDSLVVKHLLAIVDDPKLLNRRDAVRALACVAGRGESNVVSAMVACLQDPDMSRVALQTLEHVAQIGDQAVMRAIAECLGDKSSCSVALATLKTLCEGCCLEEPVLQALTPCLEDFDAHVRGMAIEIIKSTLTTCSEVSDHRHSAAPAWLTEIRQLRFVVGAA